MVNDMPLDGYEYNELEKCRKALEGANEKLERIAECLEYFLEEMDEESKKQGIK